MYTEGLRSSCVVWRASGLKASGWGMGEAVGTAKASEVWSRAWPLRARDEEKRSASQPIDGFAEETVTVDIDDSKSTHALHYVTLILTINTPPHNVPLETTKLAAHSEITPCLRPHFLHSHPFCQVSQLQRPSCPVHLKYSKLSHNRAH